MSKTTVPVFYPNKQEFLSFSNYVASISGEIKKYGACKVVPPKDFFVRDYSLKAIGHILLNNPIKQLVVGRAGVYNLSLVPLRDLSIQEFYDISQTDSYESNSYEDREAMFWKAINGNNNKWDDPMYGADTEGTLFTSDFKSTWNVNQLDNLLQLLSGELSGITTSMLYIGMWRAMFAYHTEDMFLYSINYLHTGASKSWYVIPPHYQSRFESCITSFFPLEARNCREFMRHKTKLVSPKKLKENAIQYYTIVQEPGEFVITYPCAYHSGFNHGFNIAESCNFAIPNWFKIGN